MTPIQKTNEVVRATPTWLAWLPLVATILALISAGIVYGGDSKQIETNKDDIKTLKQSTKMTAEKLQGVETRQAEIQIKVEATSEDVKEIKQDVKEQRSYLQIILQRLPRE